MKPHSRRRRTIIGAPFSALGRAVWDETGHREHAVQPEAAAFSALGRAVWDETDAGCDYDVSPLSPFSALGRAVWDETEGTWQETHQPIPFQCSRSSRMG